MNQEQTGKISHSFFKNFVQDKFGKRRDEVQVNPKFGVDVAVVNLANGQAMAMASDPLSLIPSLGLRESAWLSVQLATNDISTTGFSPMYGQFVLNLPANFPQKDFQTYWDYIHQFCEKIGIAITGGHTGFIEGQNSTIAGGATLMTIAPYDQLLTSQYAQSGDAILVTKSSGISSAAILAMSFPETVKNKTGTENYHQACESFYDLSVLKDGLIATADKNNQDVTAMHDVTEGGVLGAIYELAVASNKGVLIDKDKLPIAEVQRQVCEVFSLDPLTCTGAGAMIISCKQDAVEKVIERLQKHHIPCVEVGAITDKSQGIKIKKENTIMDLRYSEKDPYWEAFFKALKLGWT